MNTHSKGFYREIKKVIISLSSNTRHYPLFCYLHLLLELAAEEIRCVFDDI